MDISHITSQSLRTLLALTEKKGQLIKGIEELENEIGKVIKDVAKSAIDVVAPFMPKASAPARSKPASKAKAARKRSKRKMSPAGRARISAAAKARWAKRRASQPAAKHAQSAKKAARAKRAKKSKASKA